MCNISPRLIFVTENQCRYQTVFGNLQAGHYGAPQTRLRFFLIAAQQGLPLPSLPQPTHAFPDGKSLKIKLCDETEIIPVDGSGHTIAHKFVSIKDAIGDLPLWDW
jgi:DNA (cytosine-5)-methyltransferase 1